MMKDLWRALAVMAAEPPVLEQVRAVADVEERAELVDEVRIGVDPANPETLRLRRQPNPVILAKIARIFRPYGIHLAAYELAELNRWVFEDKTDHGGEAMRHLREYWQGLGELAEARKNNPEFMAAVGALALDSALRNEIRTGSTLSDQGFTLQSEEVAELKSRLAIGTVADAAAARWFSFSWSGSACGSVTMAYPSWIHTNT